jgi:RNA polymerase subunit RPABC4/transcription elongation factor Spt4
MSQELVAPDGRPAVDRCPECGSQKLETSNGFGGWRIVTCGRCHRVVKEGRD